MSRYVRPQDRHSGGCFYALPYLVGGFCILAIVFGLSYQRHSDEADMNRCLELRVIHSRGIADIAENPNRQDRPKIEDRVRKATAEHNAILAKHPTWTLPRLDTSELNR